MDGKYKTFALQEKENIVWLDGYDGLWLPQFDQSIFTVNSDNVLFRVMSQANDILLGNLQYVIHFTGIGIEAVEFAIFSYRIDEFTFWRDETTLKVATLCHCVCQRSNNLVIEENNNKIL